MQPTEPSSGLERPAPPSLDAVQTAFPQLAILDFIGQGGMGWVFKARQPKLDRLVALKLLPSSLAERDPAFAGRFEREGKLLARLHHPNIVAVYDSGTAGEFFYLLMEYVEGVNLRQAMRSSRFAPTQALAIVPHICDALQYAHEEGVLHRDIKPENILLDAKGRVKLVDFGIAKLIGAAADDPGAGGIEQDAGAHLTQSGTTLGTPSYMAPEQRETPADVDHRADIYSLGVVFYEMLTGELPAGAFTPPSTVSASDPRVDVIVRQALEKERTRRQSSAGEVKTQVQTIAGDAGGVGGNDSGEARISLKAMMSAALVLLVIPTLMIQEQLGLAITVPPGPTSSQFFWCYLALPAFLFAEICGAALLSWIAVLQIRRSTGKLLGLRLALFNGLFAPLLVPMGGIWFVVLLISAQTFQHYGYFGTLDGRLLNNLITALWIILFYASSALAAFLLYPRVSRTFVQSGGAASGSARAEPKVSSAWETAPHFSVGSGKATPMFIGAAMAILLLLAFGIAYTQRVAGTSTATPSALADSPSLLRELPTSVVIQAGLSKPISPWAWQELNRRPLTAADANQVINGLIAWLQKNYPAGFTEPLTWVDLFLDSLNSRGLVTDDQAFALSQAIEGQLHCPPRLRLREGARTLDITADWRNPWLNSLFGLKMMNEARALTVDGQPVALPHVSGTYWESQSYNDRVTIPALAPGKHIVKLEVLSALVREANLTGLAANAPSTEWPPDGKRWTRTAEMQLEIWPRDAAVIVSQTQFLGFDPIASRGLSVKQIIIRPKGSRAQAVVSFDVNEKLPVAISFDVTLQIGPQTIACGNLWANIHDVGPNSGTELTADLDLPDPKLKDADVTLTPNPTAVEGIASIDKIYGRGIVLPQMPVSRQDVGSPTAASSATQSKLPQDSTSPAVTQVLGPIIERVIAAADPARRALNLAFGNYVTPGPGRRLDFGQNGADSLRAAGVDLYAEDGMPSSVLKSLDMRFCVDDYAKITLGSVTADYLNESLTRMESWRTGMESSRAPIAPYLRPPITNIIGTNLVLFITRNDVRGALQLAPVAGSPGEVKVRYRLIQPAGGVTLPVSN